MYLKFVSAIFYQIFILQQMIALSQKKEIVRFYNLGEENFSK